MVMPVGRRGTSRRVLAGARAHPASRRRLARPSVVVVVDARLF